MLGLMEVGSGLPTGHHLRGPAVNQWNREEEEGECRHQNVLCNLLQHNSTQNQQPLSTVFRRDLNRPLLWDIFENKVAIAVE